MLRGISSIPVIPELARTISLYTTVFLYARFKMLIEYLGLEGSSKFHQGMYIVNDATMQLYSVFPNYKYWPL